MHMASCASPVLLLIKSSCYWAPHKTGSGGPEHLANVAESMGWDCAEALAQQSETAELQFFH